MKSFAFSDALGWRTEVRFKGEEHINMIAYHPVTDVPCWPRLSRKNVEMLIPVLQRWLDETEPRGEAK